MANLDNGNFAQFIIDGYPTVNANFAGRFWIASSAVTVSGPNVGSKTGFILKSYPLSTGSILIFNDGGTSGCGFPIKPGDQIEFSGSNLNLLDFAIFGIASTGCMCWMKR